MFGGFAFGLMFLACAYINIVGNLLVCPVGTDRTNDNTTFECFAKENTTFSTVKLIDHGYDAMMFIVLGVLLVFVGFIGLYMSMVPPHNNSNL